MWQSHIEINCCIIIFDCVTAFTALAVSLNFCVNEIASNNAATHCIKNPTLNRSSQILHFEHSDMINIII